jgi:hypothetical protein
MHGGSHAGGSGVEALQLGIRYAKLGRLVIAYHVARCLHCVKSSHNFNHLTVYRHISLSTMSAMCQHVAPHLAVEIADTVGVEITVPAIPLAPVWRQTGGEPRY